MRKFSEKLKELREEKGLTMLALSKSLGVGCNTIGRWERCERDITSDNLIKVADFFDVSLDYLTGRTND